MRHHVKRSRGSETCVILIGGVPASSHHFPILIDKGRSSPAIVVKLGRENVIECHTESYILHAQLLQCKRIAEVDIVVK